MKIRKSTVYEKLGFFLFRSAAWLVLLVVLLILLDIFYKGGQSISWEFITSKPRKGMTEGGIWPAIVGTFWVSLVTIFFAVPAGVFTAIYLNEYAKQGLVVRIIRLAIRNLSGVPSIVYGLFGFGLFVLMLKLGLSVISAGLTLGLLTLPWTITSSEEALKNVPMSYREGSLALGATKWQTIRINVLPYAMPGMLTGAILGLARAAGETAPILFTGAAFFWPVLSKFPKVLDSQFMALPYHLFIMSTQHHEIAKVRPLAYGTALVLIVLILMMNVLAIGLRYHFRKKYKRN
ncbi:MAG TPA: phosphate ABC transporter permease PstA [bacterium]|nr:phosphate ABC transporter permease PstA [bacterium]HPN44813.1 phosphate ABC transporter permease PstA [bacterium]